MKTLTQPIGAPSSHVATYDATDYNDEHEAEQHARSYSLTRAGIVRVNVHPMANSPYVAFSNGAEVWRATAEEFNAMTREGLRLLRDETAFDMARNAMDSTSPRP